MRLEAMLTRLENGTGECSSDRRVFDFAEATTWLVYG